VVVVKGYPRISETFVAQELLALERRGVRLVVASLRRPADTLVHPAHRAIRAPVLYLPEYLRDAPGRVLRGHREALRRAPRCYLASLRAWLADLLRDPTPNRVRRFGQAGVLAAELPPGARHFHAHFLHTPASVARYAAIMAGLGYSLSAHAKDVWICPAWELREKLEGARFCVACTEGHRAHLAALAPRAPVVRVYHGLDRALFAPPPSFGSPRDGLDPREPVRVLSVGRFQPKKGFDVLLRAVARVGCHLTLTLVGYGPEERALRALARRLRIDHRIRWVGQLDHPAVRALYRESDLFALAPRIARSGDRDGLPNVILEALSQGLPVVATRVAGVPELVEDRVHGRLVPPEDPTALALALRELAADPDARRRLGAAGLRRVSEGWDVEQGADRLLDLLAPILDAPTNSADTTEPQADAGALAARP
jgi:glycosyltransferase involved in cell wall biosynthesis